MSASSIPNSEPKWKRKRRAADEQKEAILRLVTAEVRRQRPHFFIRITAPEPMVEPIRRVMGHLFDEMLLGLYQAKKLLPEERTWVYLIPEGTDLATHYHGFMRLTRIKRRTRLLRRLLRYSDHMIGHIIEDRLRWKFGTPDGTKSNGEEHRKLAPIEVNLKRFQNRRFAYVTGYAMKRRDAAANWAGCKGN